MAAGSLVQALALGADGQQAYAPDSNTSSVDVVDTASLTVTTNLALGAIPYYAAACPLSAPAPDPTTTTTATATTLPGAGGGVGGAGAVVVPSFTG